MILIFPPNSNTHAKNVGLTETSTENAKWSFLSAKIPEILDISWVFLFCATKCATDFEFFLVEHPCLACLRGHSKVLFFLPKTAEFLHYTSFYGRSWFFQDQPLFASMDFFLIKTGSWLYGAVRRINAVLG